MSAVPTSPTLYAYVPDPKHPSTWKLRIDDALHVGLAIAALGPNPPHGNDAKIPDDARAGVIAKIKRRIGQLPISDDDKQALMARANALSK